MFNQSLLNRTIADDPVKDRDALLFQVLMQSREKTLRGTYVRGRKLEVGAQ